MAKTPSLNASRRAVRLALGLSAFAAAEASSSSLFITQPGAAHPRLKGTGVPDKETPLQYRTTVMKLHATCVRRLIAVAAAAVAGLAISSAACAACGPGSPCSLTPDRGGRLASHAPVEWT
jgi:hypothetical protein